MVALDGGELIPLEKRLEGECAGLPAFRWADLGQLCFSGGPDILEPHCPSSLLGHMVLLPVPTPVIGRVVSPQTIRSVLTPGTCTGTSFGNQAFADEQVARRPRWRKVGLYSSAPRVLRGGRGPGRGAHVRTEAARRHGHKPRHTEDGGAGRDLSCRFRGAWLCGTVTGTCCRQDVREESLQLDPWCVAAEPWETTCSCPTSSLLPPTSPPK